MNDLYLYFLCLYTLIGLLLVLLSTLVLVHEKVQMHLGHNTVCRYKTHFHDPKLRKRIRVTCEKNYLSLS